MNNSPLTREHSDSNSKYIRVRSSRLVVLTRHASSGSGTVVLHWLVNEINLQTSPFISCCGLFLEGFVNFGCYKLGEINPGEFRDDLW